MQGLVSDTKITQLVQNTQQWLITKCEPSWETQPGLLQTTPLFGLVIMAFISFRLQASVKNYPSGPGSAGPDTQRCLSQQSREAGVWHCAHPPTPGALPGGRDPRPACCRGPACLRAHKNWNKDYLKWHKTRKGRSHHWSRAWAQRCQTWSTTLCCGALRPWKHPRLW